MFDYLANPTRFRKITTAIFPVAVLVSAIALTFGLYLAFFASPADYQQGDTVRIMYIHVPAAWMAMMCYLLMALSAVFYLVWRHPLADIGARAMALPGAGFALITLLTGSFWGRPMWGTWWVWDARLTSMLILFFLYLGYMALWAAVENPDTAADLTAVLCLVGTVFAVISRYAILFWNQGLHQGASLSMDAEENVADVFAYPLWICIYNYYFDLWIFLCYYGHCWSTYISRSDTTNIFNHFLNLVCNLVIYLPDSSLINQLPG